MITINNNTVKNLRSVLLTGVAVLALASCEKYDDSGITGDLDALEMENAKLKLALETIELTPGADGIDGVDGADGVQGLTGATGDSITIVSIETSTEGSLVLFSDGSELFVDNGTSGLDGADGTNGSNGINGTNGSDGSQGIAGNDGAVGMNGSNGSNGTNGIDGIDGLAGSAGATGTIGLTGERGTDGVDGVDGVIDQDALDAQVADTIALAILRSMDGVISQSIGSITTYSASISRPTTVTGPTVYRSTLFVTSTGIDITFNIMDADGTNRRETLYFTNLADAVEVFAANQVGNRFIYTP